MRVRGKKLVAQAVTASVVLLTLATQPALASSQPGSPCSNATVSAINQYCEDIPYATGPHTGGPVTASRQATARPARNTPASRSAAATGAGDREVLALPAAGPRVPLNRAAATTASPWSVYGWLVILLIGLTALMAAGSVLQRRRRLTRP